METALLNRETDSDRVDTDNSFLLNMQHSSLQFSDSPNQQRRDIRDLFEAGENFPIKTGTEAGGPVAASNKNKNKEFLYEFAQKFNHVIQFGGDAWVAVDRSIIVPKSLDRGKRLIAKNDEMVGHGHDRVLPWIAFDHVESGVGRSTVGSIHYPTKGATPGSPNYDLNKKIAAAIEQWLKEVAKGRDLGFVNGDFNMPDRTTDWALGHNFTSMADELNAWANTGHGPIDGFCSYDLDGRVSAEEFKVLNDKRFFQFSDHYVCRGKWSIKLLAAA